ncbi:glycosyltransferase [Clostridium subterminale]|uniref:Glycosyltransferase n=1 Tax=Clostridium subterminale TaxID=1550 RepID=A0ABP3VS35_CLOSU
MKKIIFLTQNLDGGGAERVLVDTVNNLDASKYDITIMTVQNKGIYREQLNSNIKYRTLNPFKNVFIEKIWNKLIWKYFYKMIHKIFINNKYDIEIAYLEGVSTKIISQSKNRKSKKLAWVHIDLYNFFYTEKIFRNIQCQKECYSKFDNIICVSNGVKENFIKRFDIEKNVSVLYNVLDNNAICLKAEEDINYSNFENDFIICTIGRLTKQKAYDRLLRVHNKLINEGLNYKLWIIGEGEDREKLEEYIEENNLSNTVKLYGFQKNPYKYLGKSNIFVCSSIAEGFSTVATEAVILGIPVVTTDCAGMRELLEDNLYGIIVENSEKALYKGLKQIISNPEVYNKYLEKVKMRSEEYKIEKRIKEVEYYFK